VAKLAKLVADRKIAVAKEPAERIARAIQQGFDTDTVYYHGTSADIMEFESPSDSGVFLSSNPSLANTYTNRSGKLQDGQYAEGVLYPVYMNKNEFVTVTPTNVSKGLEKGVYWSDIYPDSLIVELPDGRSMSGLEYFGIAEDYKGTFNTNILAKLAKQNRAAKGVIFKDMVDIGPAYLDLPKDMRSNARQPSEVVVALDPSTIRSVNADFDPKKKNSRNILATPAPLAVATGAVAATGESQAAFAEKRDQKNTAWTQLKDAVGGLDPSFKQLSQLLSDTAKTSPMLSGQREVSGFLGNSLAGMGSGLSAIAGYSPRVAPLVPAQLLASFQEPEIEDIREGIRSVPEAVGLGSMEENLINQALMDAMQGVGDAVSDTAAYQAFVEPALQDIAPDAMEFYEGLDPRLQGQLSGIFEYIGNAIR